MTEFTSAVFVLLWYSWQFITIVFEISGTIAREN